MARENLTSEKHEGRTTVTVNLEDVNDNRPEFKHDSYNASIPENSPRGSTVTAITVRHHILIVVQYHSLKQISGEKQISFKQRCQ